MDIRSWLKKTPQSDESTTELDVAEPSQSNTVVDSEIQSASNSPLLPDYQPDNVVPDRANISSDPVTHSAPTSCDSQNPFPREPYQPDVSLIPTQAVKGKKLKFQQKWFDNYTWLHYDIDSGSVLCHVCVTAKQNNLLGLAKNSDAAFLSKGFKNWRKGVEKFEAHAKSQTHRLASSNLLQKKKSDGVLVQMNKGLLQEQKQSRACLLKLISSLKYLAGQGLAIQGRKSDDGNFIELLNLRSEDIEGLRSWLARKHSYTSHHIQNDILRIMCHMILRKIVKDVNNPSKVFGIIVDGTQDIQGKEQQSICLRYVSDTFDIKEEFLGLYNVDSTSGEAICAMILDALIRLQLSAEKLRSQTYNGAANMSGKFHGCQAAIKKHQPLARFIHCGAHITQLVVAKSVQQAAFIRDALDHIHEFDKLYTRSAKFKHLYLSQNYDDVEVVNPGPIKPIYPTRWLTRFAAVKSVLQNYSHILNALQTAAENFGTSGAARANGIYACLANSKCVLGLHAASPILELLETLNRSLQGSSVQVHGMIRNVQLVKTELSNIRTSESFESIFKKAQEMIDGLGLEPVILPKRKIPRRFQEGEAAEHQFKSAEEVYRTQFYAAIDVAITSLDEYFDSPDITEYQELSNMLVTGAFSSDLVKNYPELGSSTLAVELQMYVNNFKRLTLAEHLIVFREMEQSVRRMFPAVENLLRLLLTSPASSCEAERSFSALRRLKTWLRSTMTQTRLNHVAICHGHRDMLSEISGQEIAEEFVRANDARCRVFGKF